MRVVASTKENAKMIFDAIEKNREYLESWQGHFGAIKTVDDVVAYLNKRNNQTLTNDGMCFYVYHADNLVGRIRFFDVHDNSCEIGYWLVESENGYGFMSEALFALEKELFNFGFDKIILDIDDGNIKSESVAKRNGYKLVKRLPMGSWAKCVGKCDSLIYEKIKNPKFLY